MRKLVVNIDLASAERLDRAVAACNTSRAKFIREVLRSAADAVFEREQLYKEFESAYAPSGGFRAKARL
jgi:hypothetical protein